MRCEVCKVKVSVRVVRVFVASVVRVLVRYCC